MKTIISKKMILFIYLRVKAREQGGGAKEEGEADSSQSREPDVGSEPKADAEPRSHPSACE